MTPQPNGHLTPKQEAFVAAYIETGNASEAYRRSYNVSRDCKPNTIEKRACELLKNGKVAGRVAAAKAKVAQQHEITVERITTMMMDAYNKAMKEGKGASAGVAAATALAKLHGLIVEKKYVESDNRHHHQVSPVSAFDGFLEEAAGGRAEGDTPGPLQN